MKFLATSSENALVAQGSNQPVKEGRGIPIADSLPQVFPLRPKTGFFDEGGGASDVADLENQPGGMGEGRILFCR
jgi:hypothetical protein